MTLEEIARALGVQTTAQIAKACGADESEIRAVMPPPTLVLDYRGLGDARRWERYAKADFPQLTKKLGLDPCTGLRVVRVAAVDRKKGSNKKGKTT